MASAQKKIRKSAHGLPEMIFFVGALLALMGALDTISTPSSKVRNSNTTVSPSVIERKLSIEDAIKNGQKTYQFRSGFIPGIGIITDPEAYLKELEENSKEQP